MRALVSALFVACALAGCTSTLEQLPASMGGLPEGVPPRAETPAAFPAVHDMPPKRNEVVLTEAEKRKLREDLAAQRERRASDAKADINADGSPTGSTGARARNP
jgi:hypothetical protein